MNRKSGLLVTGALIATSLHAWAAPLDAETCTRLKGEQAGLEKAGVRNSMDKGPQWAKANLAPERLVDIKRLIEIDEQLLFRCQGGGTLVQLPPDIDDPAAAPKDDDKSEGETPSAPPAPGAPTAKAVKAGVAPDKGKAPSAGKAPAKPGEKAASANPSQPPAKAPAKAPAKDAKAPPKDGKAAPKAAAAPPPAAQKAPPPKAPANTAAKAPAKDAAGKEAAKAAPKPKPKVDDAYRPPQ